MVLFMAPVTPLLQWDPNPMRLTSSTARILIFHGIVLVLVDALLESSSPTDTWVAEVAASFD